MDNEPLVYNQTVCESISQGHFEVFDLTGQSCSGVVQLAQSLLPAMQETLAKDSTPKWETELQPPVVEKEGPFAVSVAGENLQSPVEAVEKLKALSLPENCQHSMNHRLGYDELQGRVLAECSEEKPFGFLYTFGDCYGYNGYNSFVAGYRAVLGYHDAHKTEFAYLNQNLTATLVEAGAYTDPEICSHSRSWLKNNLLGGIVSAYAGKPFP